MANPVIALGDDDVCPYEKYEGTKMRDIPATFLLWLEQQDEIQNYPEVQGYIDWARTCLEAEIRHGSYYW